MVFGFVLSSVIYLLMAVLMLILVCLVVILYASILVVLPMLAKISIHFVNSVWLVGMGGMLLFIGENNAIMAGWL